MTTSPLTRRALAAALAVAARHGLRCAAPEILRDASNLLVLLRPAPVVARVTTVTSTFRPGDDWLAREVAMAGYLAAAGAPVVPPSDELPPGPHEHGGLVLSFWPYIDEADRPLDAAEAGRRLLACHDLLRDFPGELPVLGVLDEVDRMLAGLRADATLGAGDDALLAPAPDGEAIDVFVDARRYQAMAVGIVMAREQPTKERRARRESLLAAYRERG